MKTYTLENGTGQFTIDSNNGTEPIILRLDGQELINMGWDIENDKPEDQYELYITENEIDASILCSNGEYSDTGWTFEYVGSITDLIRHGYLMIADENGDEDVNGTLQEKP